MQTNDAVLQGETESTVTTLDLSRRNLQTLPDHLPDAEKLQCLYLEGNRLTELPASLFNKCCNLIWLDVRNNMLTTLPAAVRHMRGLRTLLLEGNMLTHLPRELGELTHLVAINLSRNPLQSPPQCVIANGTKAILEYLRSRPDDGDVASISGPEPTAYHPAETLTNKSTRNAVLETYCTPHLVGVTTQLEYPATSGRLPGPVPKQALLHVQPAHTKKDIQSASKGKLLPVRRKKQVPVSRVQEKSDLSPQAREEIATTLQREKDIQCLDDWKEESKRLQRQQYIQVSILKEPVNYTTAAETAPYATEANSCHVLPSAIKSNTNYIEPSERARLIATHLQEQRSMLGLNQAPSKELIDAEVKLAEALLKRQELEARKKTEYRLTAFTGDLQ